VGFGKGFWVGEEVVLFRVKAGRALKRFWVGEELIWLMVGCLQLQRSCFRLSFKMQSFYQICFYVFCFD
jgi:hypothetical protein